MLVFIPVILNIILPIIRHLVAKIPEISGDRIEPVLFSVALCLIVFYKGRNILSLFLSALWFLLLRGEVDADFLKLITLLSFLGLLIMSAFIEKKPEPEPEIEYARRRR